MDLATWEPSSSREPAAGTNPIGGAFRVVTTSLVPNTGAAYADGSTLSVSSPPSEVVVTFSGNVNPQDIAATDLILSGTAINSLNPAHATSLSWIDAHTVEFNLAGQFNSTGTIDIEIEPGLIKSATGTTNLGYSDNVVLNVVSDTGDAGHHDTSPGAGPTGRPVTGPAPTGPHKKKAHHVAVHHPAKHVVVIHPKTTKHVWQAPKPSTSKHPGQADRGCPPSRRKKK